MNNVGAIFRIARYECVSVLKCLEYSDFVKSLHVQSVKIYMIRPPWPAAHLALGGTSVDRKVRQRHKLFIFFGITSSAF